MHRFSVTLSFAPRHLSDRQKVLYIHSALLLQHWALYTKVDSIPTFIYIGSLRTHHDCQTLNRQRNNILWYNPPFSKNVSTNIRHKFLSLIDKHFPKDHSLRKIFNRNTIKISYSCMNNTKQVIDNHNKRILHSSHSSYTKDNKDGTRTNKTCNCRQKNNCSLNGNCLQSSVVYQATVTRNDNNTSETYIGLTETDFKTRHRNHTASFRHAKHKNSTELSKHIWTLKNDNIDYSISWRVLSSSSPYNSSSKRCNLCLKEKFLIIYQPDLSSLSKRNELISSCRHRNKALLCNSWTLKFLSLPRIM